MAAEAIGIAVVLAMTSVPPSAGIAVASTALIRVAEIGRADARGRAVGRVAGGTGGRRWLMRVASTRPGDPGLLVAARTVCRLNSGMVKAVYDGRRSIRRMAVHALGGFRTMAISCLAPGEARTFVAVRAVGATCRMVKSIHNCRRALRTVALRTACRGRLVRKKAASPLFSRTSVAVRAIAGTAYGVQEVIVHEQAGPIRFMTR
ncbi:MAG: hypothetical protein A2X94_00590 [Bdellovibrionales bacterium GWB1_55_8]|nr:MAG: hypothetical protein A2X94_00590 [Bdellovibrionales bacterium GWB1_55_8]